MAAGARASRQGLCRFCKPSFVSYRTHATCQQPLASAGYTFFRNVVTDYHADSSGKTDTTEHINAAIQDGNRCGEECGNTFADGAIIYFPAGRYKICRPIVQLYYTQFIGDPLNPPTIVGCDEFAGIALIDTDPYIPGGNGQNWYINRTSSSGRFVTLSLT